MRGTLLTGFPWCLLGYSQYDSLKLIQIVDTVGVYGISFLILMVNTLIFLVFVHNSTRQEVKFLRLEAIMLLCFMIVTLLYGNYRLSEADDALKNNKSVRVAIIQGNIDQSVKWDKDYQDETLSVYYRLTRISYTLKPHLIIWPETAVPFYFQDNVGSPEDIYDIPVESGAQMIFGSPAYEWDGGKVKYYNRIYILSPDGTSRYYDKVHLVPFGEYVPLKGFLPFINYLVSSEGEFSPGKNITPLRSGGLSLGPLVCYEAVIPELSRTHVKKGADILVNLTNDAWFGITSAPYQHFIMSVFRAVENRRPLLRAANTGFSGIIDSYGRITLVGGLFSEEVLMGEIKTGDDSLTFYSKYGDIFVYIILVLCLIKFISELCYHLLKRRET
jgi:apolipoprotein N-acyltransferase